MVARFAENGRATNVLSGARSGSRLSCGATGREFESRDPAQRKTRISRLGSCPIPWCASPAFTALGGRKGPVWALGEQTIPEAFRATELPAIASSSSKCFAHRPAPRQNRPRSTMPRVAGTPLRAVAATSRDSGWASLSTVGSYIAKKPPSFDTRLCGRRQAKRVGSKAAVPGGQGDRRRLHTLGDSPTTVT
jgi:hypothetical protein